MILTIFLWIVLAVLAFLTFCFYEAYKDEKTKDTKSDDKKFFSILTVIFSILFLILLVYLVAPSSSNDKQSSEPKTEKKATKKAAKKEPKKETAKEKADKKEKAEVAAARKKNMAKNFEDYKEELSQASTKTNGAIADAYVSKENGETIVVLSDDALDLNDNQLHAVSHSAWNAIQRMQDNYRIRENENAHGANLVQIQDSAGDVIATTSFMGDFKYKGLDD